MFSELKVLCLEDDEEDYDFIREVILNGGYRLSSTRVYTKEAFTEALALFKPDVILSDHSLPTFDSTEALLIAKKKCPHVPFILVTGAVSDEFAVKSLKLGADDYLLKSNLIRLPSVIENALKQKEAELAKKNAAKQLEKRNHELSKINRELDSFVYSVSHNLRAPLMSVLGLVNLASKETDLGNIRQYHSLMQQSILTLDNTLKDILEYARNARQELKIQEVNLRRIIEDNLERMRFMSGFDAIQKNVEVSGDAIFYSDPYRLSVIFNNLISNAAKYADPAKGVQHIEVTAKVNEEHAEIVFADNGIGIEKSLQPKVFDMFVRATDSSQGAGLGLYILREALEVLHGEVEMESTAGEGTTFRIRIPNQLKREGVGGFTSRLVDRD